MKKTAFKCSAEPVLLHFTWQESLKNSFVTKTLHQTCSVNFPMCWFGILRKFTGILLGTDSQEALHRSQPHQDLYLEQQLQFNQSISSVLGDAFKTGAIQVCWLRLALRYFLLIYFPPHAASTLT